MCAAANKPKVLFVYYTYTQQARRVTEVMAEVLRNRGCDVQQAEIEFTDPRFAERFARVPLRHAVLDLAAMLIPQLRRKTGEIRIPQEATEGDYDLICIGSPTWWLTTCMPVRSFLETDSTRRLMDGKLFAAFVVCRRYWRNNLDTVKKMGTENGGEWVDGVPFTYFGGQVRSLLSLISDLGSGEYRQRYMGVKIPPTNLQSEHLETARAFAGRLAGRLLGAPEMVA